MCIVTDLPMLAPVGLAIIRRILASHLGAVYSILAMKNKAAQIKAGLKLLVAMVMQGEGAARDVHMHFDWSSKLLPPLLNRRDTKV